MALFVVQQESRRSVTEAWRRLTDWARHARYVPLTRTEVTTQPPNGLGTLFVARSGIGRWGFDDPMEVVEWQPPADGRPARCRIEKRGPVMRGWAELTVEATAAGSRATWREDITVGRLPGFADRGTALVSRLLFGRVLRRLLED